VSDAAVAAKYILNEDVEQVDTSLLVGADATAEANRRLTLKKTQRTRYSFKGFAKLLELELGDTITITNSRFGMSAGSTGLVVGLVFDWLNFRTTVSVIM